MDNAIKNKKEKALYGIWDRQNKCWKRGICEENPETARVRFLKFEIDVVERAGYEVKLMPKDSENSIRFMTKKEMKKEALERMKLLDISDDVKRIFASDDGTVLVSEPPNGVCYTLTAETKKVVKEFEEKQNALVYLVIRSDIDFYRSDSFLYVSNDCDEWEKAKDDLKLDKTKAYVYDRDTPELSKIDYIGIRKPTGILRTW